MDQARKEENNAEAGGRPPDASAELSSAAAAPLADRVQRPHRKVLRKIAQGLRWLRRAFIPPLGKIRDGLRTPGLGIFAGWCAAFIRSIHANFKANKEDMSAMRDYEELLARWGIQDESMVPRVLRNLKFRMVILCLFALAIIWIELFHKTATFITYCTIAAAAFLFFTVLLISIWRITVLKRKKFIPFKDWLLRRKGNFA
jgi:hypothetical protein